VGSVRVRLEGEAAELGRSRHRRKVVWTAKLLRAIGYWREDWDLLPHPRWLVRRRWRVGERTRMTEYLRGGRELAAYLGFSWCRFHCGIDDTFMGTRDLTDGVWVWPEGLVHYVESHGVRLPDEFMLTMASNGWVVPAGVSVVCPDVGQLFDLSFWRWWAFRHAGPCCWL